jgi:hypothetical protein
VVSLEFNNGASTGSPPVEFGERMTQGFISVEEQVAATYNLIGRWDGYAGVVPRHYDKEPYRNGYEAGRKAYKESNR